MAQKTRLAGHSLRGEGKAFTELAGAVVTARPWAIGTGGTGFALCECGWRSEVIDSSVKRRSAHRLHRLDVQAGQA